MAFKAKIIDHYNEVISIVNADTLGKLPKAGQLVRNTMRGEVPVRRGKLKKSIRTRLERAQMAVKIIVGNKEAWYPHIVIGGTGPRVTSGKGLKRKQQHSTGTMPANDFATRSLEQNLEALRALFGKEIITGSGR